jgi:hypothetical protein
MGTKTITVDLRDENSVIVVWNDRGQSRDNLNALVIRDEKPIGLIGYFGEESYFHPIHEVRGEPDISGLLQEVLAVMMVKLKLGGRA